MDDLELCNSKQEDLKQQINTTYRFPNDTKMEFKHEKFTKISIRKGEQQQIHDIEIDHNKRIIKHARD